MVGESQPLVIVGASGWGKEVAWLARRAGFIIKGFLDDNATLSDGTFFKLPVLGRVDDWSELSGCQFVVAIASPRIRKRIVDQMYNSGTPQFAKLIDPAANLELESASIGAGSVVCAGSIITADVGLGEHTFVNKLCSIGHDVHLGDYVTIAPQVMLGGNVFVHSGAEIGASSAIRQGVQIHQGAMVGMGSLVLADVEPNLVVVGSPVKVMKKLEEFDA